MKLKPLILTRAEHIGSALSTLFITRLHQATNTHTNTQESRPSIRVEIGNCFYEKRNKSSIWLVNRTHFLPDFPPSHYKWTIFICTACFFGQILTTDKQLQHPDAGDWVFLQLHLVWLSHKSKKLSSNITKKKKKKKGDLFVCFSWRSLSSQALMWIQLHKDRGKTYYDKRWGEGCSYTSVQFQHFLFSMHACLAVYALEGAEILKDREKMLWSKTACGKVFSSNSSVPITLLFCTYVCHPIFFFLIPWGKRLNKFFRADINPHLHWTHKTYRKQVKRSFCWKSQEAHTT